MLPTGFFAELVWSDLYFVRTVLFCRANGDGHELGRLKTSLIVARRLRKS